jgi:hypothetical protein
MQQLINTGGHTFFLCELMQQTRLANTHITYTTEAHSVGRVQQSLINNCGVVSRTHTVYTT